MTRIRTDIWAQTHAEGDWPAVLVAYERAVGLLRAADPPGDVPTNPLGWRFLAAIHGRAGADGNPDTSQKLWSNCQHGSWYFLAWHRMYLMAFELIVQHVLADDQWALPYWYAIDPDDATKAVLPPAFRDTRPGNNLYTDRRSLLANSGAPLPNLAPAVIAALDADLFSTPLGTSTFGGGERATASFSGGERGLVEGTPHGAVHSLVGNDYRDGDPVPIRNGWMGSFYTAGLDPIFWLHHANIDRLWEVWLEHDLAHVNPTGDPAWFDTTYSFPAVTGDLISWSIGEVLDTAALGYKYESTAAPQGVAPPPAVPVGGRPDVGLAEVDMPEPLPPQVLGATLDVPVASTDAVEVELSEPIELGLAADADVDVSTRNRIYLRIEGVTGTAAAPVYQVYLNVPLHDAPDDHPELRVGFLSTFGLAEASQRNDVHDGSGLTDVFDITPVRDVLQRQGRWDPHRLHVSFSPVIPAAPDPSALPGAAELEAAEVRPADLRAGQITVVAT
jgi:tyrosinase